MKIRLIAGLPGSGKSHLAASLAAQDRALGLDPVVVDDISDLSQLPTTADTLTITDVNLCRSTARVAAHLTLRKRYPQGEVEWFFFENAPSKCRANVAGRNDGRNVEGTIVRFEQEYSIPEGHTPLPVWQG